MFLQTSSMPAPTNRLLCGFLLIQSLRCKKGCFVALRLQHLTGRPFAAGTSQVAGR